MLGYSGYDKQVYENTRKRLLSSKTNKYYFEGSQFKGMGSPHTSHNMAWALGIYTEALTAPTPEEQAEGLRTLLKLQCGDGLMHESVNVDNVRACTRKWFEWANALLVISVEQLLGYDCDDAAQAFHRGSMKVRCWVQDAGAQWVRGVHMPVSTNVQLGRNALYWQKKPNGHASHRHK